MQRFKSWLKAFALIFCTVFMWEAPNEIEHHFIYKNIEKAYAETAASGYDIIPLDRKNPPDTLYIRFYYEVDGKTYPTKTSRTDSNGAQRYLSENPVLIAYTQGKPHLATLKRYYDLNHHKSRLHEIIVVHILFALMVATSISLVFIPFFKTTDNPEQDPLPMRPFIQ